MPQVLSWNPPAAPHAELIASCVRALKGGQLVGIACETCYFIVADPDNKKAMAKLQQLVGDKPKLPILEVHAVAERPDKIMAGGGLLARRVARRVWPGPVAISAVTEKKGAMTPRYAPNSGSARQLVQAMGKPLPFGTVIGKNGLPPANVGQLNELVGEHLAIVLDAGPTPFGNLPTLIEITGSQFRIPVVGTVPAAALAEQTAWFISFVCTGNTCRSPLAEGLCKKLLAEKLKCELDDLVGRGYRVSSMGLSAMPGNTATSEALIVAREFKTDLSAHRSQPIMPEVLEVADHVIAMTAIHRDSIVAIYPNLESTTRLLCGTQDLADPIGSDLEVYRTCAKTIQKNLDKLVGEMLAAGAPTLLP